MGTQKLKVHRYHFRQKVDISILEIRSQVFVWLCVYLDPVLRNGKVSVELIRFVLWDLGGVHHIHVLRSLKSLHGLAKSDNWIAEGRSRYFEECRAYRAASPHAKPDLAPLFAEIMKHSTCRKVPFLPSFRSQRDAART